MFCTIQTQRMVLCLFYFFSGTMQTQGSDLLVYYVYSLLLFRHNDLAYWYYVYFFFGTMQTQGSGLLVYYVYSFVLCRHNDLAYWYYVYFIFFFFGTMQTQRSGLLVLWDRPQQRVQCWHEKEPQESVPQLHHTHGHSSDTPGQAVCAGTVCAASVFTLRLHGWWTLWKPRGFLSVTFHDV